MEQTLSIIKPDAVERHLEDEIKQMFLEKGFKIIKEKKIQIEKTEAELFYQVHQTKPFYNDLCAYLSSGPIVVMIIERENAIKENVKNILLDYKSYKDRAIRGRNHIIQTFNWDKITSEYEKAICEAIRSFKDANL